MRTLDFVPPEDLEATEPPPVRDGVRLLVASVDGLTHARFSQLGEFLAPGDLVVVNTSATLAAAVDGQRARVPVGALLRGTRRRRLGDRGAARRDVHRAGYRPAPR